MSCTSSRRAPFFSQVKAAFADRELARDAGLTSANSINVGRLLPQIVYYFHAANQLPAGEPAALFAVASGNFGDLTAGLLAQRMGLGAAGFVAATNANDVVPEYLRTGRSPLPCKALRAGVFVNAQGDVHPCTVYGRKLGNLLETPLFEILDGAEAQDAREVVKRDACPGCWSPCEANPTIVATAPESLARRPR